MEEGVSVQNSYTLKVMQKNNNNQVDFCMVSCIFHTYQSYWMCDMCDRVFMLKNISCRQCRQSVVKRVNFLRFIGASVKQRIRESKKSYD